LLKDFDFHALFISEGERIEIDSGFLPLGIDTSILLERVLVL